MLRSSVVGALDYGSRLLMWLADWCEFGERPDWHLYRKGGW